MCWHFRQEFSSAPTAPFHAGEARTEVSDASPAMPSLRRSGPNRTRSSRTGGRDLLAVAAIAAQWGVQLHPSGKTAWELLPVPERIGGRLSCDRALPSSGTHDSSHVSPRGSQAEVGTRNDAPSTGLPEGGRGFRGAPALPCTTSLSEHHRDREYRVRAENRQAKPASIGPRFSDRNGNPMATKALITHLLSLTVAETHPDAAATVARRA